LKNADRSLLSFQVADLVEALNPRGIRELALKNVINKNMARITMALKKRNQVSF
jgi:hypothetical protein